MLLYLTSNESETMKPLIPTLIDEGFRARPQKTWPKHDGGYLDRRNFVSASEVSYCARRIVFDKLSRVENSPQGGDLNYGFAERGHTAEAWIVDNLRNNTQGYEFEFVGDAQVSFHYGNQSGTPDGLMTDPKGARALLEFKCIDPRTSRKGLPKKGHVAQCIQNMHLIMQCLDIWIEKAYLIYIDASNYQDVLEFVIEYDEDEARKLEARAAQIMEYTSPEEAPPEGVYTGDCKYCNFKSQCSGAEEAKKRETAKLKGLSNVAQQHFR